MASKEFELTHAALRYITACLIECDWSALRDMEIGPREAQALQDISLTELIQLERRLAGHVLQVKVDRAAFWAVMDQIRDEGRHRQLRLDLIRLGAPAEMMQALFGMPVKEYTAARRVLGAPPTVGRPPEPSEEEARAVWLAWEQLGQAPSLSPSPAWLDIAEITGLPLRLIWRVTQRWCATEADETPTPPTGKLVRVRSTSESRHHECA
ncbi:MAG TPA: STY4526/YPO1902 family pathogenicity island replication protein [Thiohalobacter sp.]|nr:STY4526/YPO1902 family pathogenicity island replication protein [Thiohalobacter sp.]